MKTAVLTCIVAALVPMAGCHHNPADQPLPGTPNWQPDAAHLAQLKAEESGGNGIEVGQPKIYDDASLRMMLTAARNQLANISGLNQASLTQSIGAVSGARIDQSQIGLQVSGPSAPGIASTNTGATNSVTTNGSLPSQNTTIPGTVTVATQPTQNVTTTTTGAAPPAAPTVPAGIGFTPPTGIAPSSSDVLNEQMQLTYEIANLQLLLEGALSDRYVINQRFVKPRTTIGFPISLRPPARFKNAVAVVDVEVETAPQNLADASQPEPPAITALLPREKTYNVSAMTDRTTSIGAGAVVGAVGVSGSYMRGKKTLYLVQDQDTVALQRPPDPNRGNVTSFLWEFRPVLGREYVRGGMKQTFVQLALPILSGVDCFGSIRIRTYWRRFDRKNGMTGDVIEGSLLASSRNGAPLRFPIPHYDLTPFVEDIDYQDLGDGTVLVKVLGTFLAGTYVQLGPTLYAAGNGLIFEDNGVKFVAPITALARWTGHIVARSGEQADLLMPLVRKKLPALAQTACVEGAAKALQPATPLAAPAPEACTAGSMKNLKATATQLNESDSLVRVEFDAGLPEKARQQILFEIGGKVFGLKDNVVKREGGADKPVIVAVVPTALLIASPRVRAFWPFWSAVDSPEPQCFKNSAELTDFGLDSAAERLVLVSVDKDGNATYLLYGNGLDNATVLVPDKDATLTPVDHIAGGRIRLLTIKKGALQTTKKLVLQKDGMQRPLVLDLPQPVDKATPPKVSADSPVIQNTDALDVSAEHANEIAGIKMDDQALQWKLIDDSSLRLLNLKASGITSEQKTRELTFTYKNGASATLTLEVVAARIGVK